MKAEGPVQGDAMLLPPQTGAAFQWLYECLDVAYPVDGPAPRGPAELSGSAAASAAPHADPVPDGRPANPAALIERRTDDRAKMTLYRSATLRWGASEGLCLIRNLSPGGMMCRSVAALPEGERVEIEVRSGRRIAGVVSWVRDQQLGIRFDRPIDVAEVLNGAVPGGPPVQRMPRLTAGCAVTLTAENGSRPAMLLDLSQGGAKIEAPFLREGDQVTLATEGLDARAGTVRWVQDGRAGIAFLQPIPFEALARWAIERPADQRVGTGSALE